MATEKGFVQIDYHMAVLAEGRETIAALEARIAVLRQEITALQNENDRLRQWLQTSKGPTE
jgi:uncharacterized small protein (DUF1192 family)